jgi:hypothetical protein
MFNVDDIDAAVACPACLTGSAHERTADTTGALVMTFNRFDGVYRFEGF